MAEEKTIKSTEENRQLRILPQQFLKMNMKA